ncbi:MAG: hypothetical protein MUC87_20840 [Bacteroidia bacterium]|jgi:lysozyme family protein|nr:hypothetical protein [Bacteroidia bacterium]
MASYKNQVAFIKKWEGGLSNDPRDINPASFPAPCTYMGQTGWHTNKGITYQTFYHNAARLNYAPSCANFFTMPDVIWLKIYKYSFWDKFYLDDYRSQAIADVIVSLAWGSGVGGAYKQVAKFLNANFGTQLPAITTGYSQTNAKLISDTFHKHTRTALAEKKVHEKLLEHYRQFYISLNNPTYIRGWLRRVGELDSFTQDALRVNNSQRNVLYFGAAAASVAALALIAHLIVE